MSRETKYDIQRVPRNYDPDLHPFEVPREYTRAMNATKLERVLAKPFLASLDGHRDAVNCMAKHATSLSTLLSGACDGEVKVWNLTKRECVRTIQAHEGFVRGMVVRFCGTSFFSTVFTGLDHHQKDGTFATCGQHVDIWDEQRSTPIRSFSWGVESFSSVRFNPIETELLASCASDRSIVLYDMRESTPLKKVIMTMRSNTILYTYDMRFLEKPVTVHMDHVSAVLDVDYAPTGREFVSASFDKSIRIFPKDTRHSRSEVYHTKRMQHVVCVKWSADNKYVMSGSDEMNIRLWKANAAEKLGVLSHRERLAANYNQKLKEKFEHHPKVKRIARHRHLPKQIYMEAKEHSVMREARRRKERNVRKHSKPGSVPVVSEREKHVVAVETRWGPRVKPTQEEEEEEEEEEQQMGTRRRNLIPMGSRRGETDTMPSLQRSDIYLRRSAEPSEPLPSSPL
ncbi:LOW QUALITY PROTEIN: hypothetical protein CRUP_031415, partial [Coryphaenoides rupestris]